MKLYELKGGTKIYESVSDGSSYFTYHHSDGAYGFCLSEKGEVCHLGMTVEVVRFKDGFKFAK